MAKKIGLLNFHYSNNNYGAVLQAAALNKVIDTLGYRVETIDFIPDVSQQKQTFKNKMGTLLRVLGLRAKIPIAKVIENASVFEDFRVKWLPRSSSTYQSIDDLSAISSEYSVVIVGSDQVWRPAMTQPFALAYFLSFVPNTCRRISYAASFGVDYWQEKNISTRTEVITEEIKKFHAVSVREDSGLDICKNIFNVKAQHVLDPTLLVGRAFFEDVINQAAVSSEPSEIVYYKLDVDEDFLHQLRCIERKLGYSSEDIYHTNVSGKYFFTPVAEWLLKLRGSKLIISDSFHCICFAIIFEKEFIYYPNAERGMSRLESLLKSVGLENRICKDQDMLINLEANYVVGKIDYVAINQKLQQLRKVSILFLKNSIS